MDKIQRVHLGIITGIFMVASYILFYMGGDSFEFLYELRVNNELYFVLFALMAGFLCSQMFIWYYNKGRKL